MAARGRVVFYPIIPPGKGGSKPMKALGQALMARLYRQLKPWLEALERQDAGQESTILTPGLLYLPGFLIRLQEEVVRAWRYHRELGLLVFEVPRLSPRQQRAVEGALRYALRRADVPARLSDHQPWVLLPETSQGAAAARLGHRLSEVAGHPISGGYACYPADGKSVADLLRIAGEHSRDPARA
jgi:hypothetical protein